MAYGTCLESKRVNPHEGSNPSLSAISDIGFQTSDIGLLFKIIFKSRYTRFFYL